MKILPNTNIVMPINAVDLAPACEASLFKVKAFTYAFIAPNQNEPYLVIQSEIFDLLMQRLCGRIVEMNVFRQLCMCCGGIGSLTIRLTEADGCVSQFHEDDELELCMDVETLYQKRNARN